MPENLFKQKNETSSLSVDQRIEALRRRGRFLGKLYFLICVLALLAFGIAIIYMFGHDADFFSDLFFKGEK